MDILIILAVTADVMFAAVACGASGIRIHPRSCAVMACVSSGFLVLSAFGSGLLLRGLPENTIRWIGCIALVCIGLMQIAGGFGAQLLDRISHLLPGHLRRTAEISRDYTKADADGNKTLSPSEAFVLAIPVSIDSLIGGLSITADGAGLLLRFVIGFVCGYVSVYFGSRAAFHIPIRSEKLRSLICGLMLIGLGLAKRVL